ncbi:hypothetical protein HYX13_01095, partial [Candidatus Woesearchaeota archaeon]|nr:hypothetical protein [Candidatus Woesearchaeota archaeon]
MYCSDGETSTPSVGATVSWRKGKEQGVLTSTGGTLSDGMYRSSVNFLGGLEEGTYTLFAEDRECGSAQQIVTLSGGENLVGIDFFLRPQAFQGVKGKVTLSGVDIPGAQLYVDDRFVRRTELDGTYRIILPADGQPHTIYATYADYYQSTTTSFLLNTAHTEETADLVLTRIAGECSPDNLLEVRSFTASAVPGEEEVFLTWAPPNCPGEIESYHIIKTEQGSTDQQTIDSIFPATSFTDTEVSFGKTYTYTIYVMYHFGTSLDILSSPGFDDTVTLGFEECFGRSAFCPVDGSDAVSFCTADGRIEGSAPVSCPTDLVCGPVAGGEAGCRVVDECSKNSEGTVFGDPFGLFYDRATCYGNFLDGTKPDRFCTYDIKNNNNDGDTSASFSDPRVSTIVNSCLSCTKISSCFDYQSKDACEVNSCRVEECKWIDAAQNKARAAESSAEDSADGNVGKESQEIVDYSSLGDIATQLGFAQSVTSETGAGYCVQEDYGKSVTGKSLSSGKDDYCSLCDAKRQPFEDYFCT